MIITDAQVHIWTSDTPGRPWPSWGLTRAQRLIPLEAAELIGEMDAARVDRTVIVPPSWEGDRNDLAFQAVADYPGRFAIMGRVDLLDAANLDVTGWRDQPGMLGIRLSFRPDNQLSPFPFSNADWFWPHANKAELPIMVFSPGNTGDIGKVARKYPDLRVIIDHLNLPTSATAQDIAPAVDALIPLAALKNVAVKVSALPCAISEAYPFSSLSPHVRRTVDTFGVERCFWGSDLSRLPCPYADWVNAMADGLGCLSANETEWIMGKALSIWLDWPEPS